MTLAGDVPMGLVHLIILLRPLIVFISLWCDLLQYAVLFTDSIPAVGVVVLYLSSLWQVEEKLIVIFSPMNMDVAGYDFPLVPRLNQSPFLIFFSRWNELNEQASLVLHGSSSHITIFSAYGAVCMVIRVTLDAISQEAYDVVMI